MNLTSGPSEHAALRVVLDECVGLGSPLVRRFEESLRPEQRVEFTRSPPRCACHQGSRQTAGWPHRRPRLPCVKGPFFLAMEHKLNELARASRSNELVPVDFSNLIESLNNSLGPSVRDSSG